MPTARFLFTFHPSPAKSRYWPRGFTRRPERSEGNRPRWERVARSDAQGRAIHPLRWPFLSSPEGKDVRIGRNRNYLQSPLRRLRGTTSVLKVTEQNWDKSRVSAGAECHFQNTRCQEWRFSQRGWPVYCFDNIRHRIDGPFDRQR